MIQDLQLVVQAEDKGMRVDAFVLAKSPSSTRALILKAMIEKQIRLNNRPAAKGNKTCPGDVIHILKLYEQSDRRVLPDTGTPLNVLFEDDALLVLNKPPGIPVHPLRIGETGSLANAMIARYPALAEIGDDPLFPALAHRIDTDTSGVVIAARTREVYSALRRQFRERKVLKEYVALVQGVAPARGKLEHYLTHNPARRGQMIASPEAPIGKGLRPMHAVTEYKRNRMFTNFTLLDVVIRTGVTHQIRCQLAAAGFPIAGDALYGGDPESGIISLSRHFLHASALTLKHPVKNIEVRFEASLPEDLQHVLEKLS